MTTLPQSLCRDGGIKACRKQRVNHSLYLGDPLFFLCPIPFYNYGICDRHHDISWDPRRVSEGSVHC